MTNQANLKNGQGVLFDAASAKRIADATRKVEGQTQSVDAQTAYRDDVAQLVRLTAHVANTTIKHPGLYTATEVIWDADTETWIDVVDGLEFDSDFPLCCVNYHRDIPLSGSYGNVVQVFPASYFDSTQSYSYNMLWTFYDCSVPFDTHFGGAVIEDQVYIANGRIVTPDDEAPVSIDAENYPLGTDKYIYLTATLTKASHTIVVSTELQDAASAPDDYAEDEDEIEWNYIIGAISSGVWYQYSVGDWLIPHNIYLAEDYNYDVSQVLGHKASAVLSWLDVDSCDYT